MPLRKRIESGVGSWRGCLGVILIALVPILTAVAALPLAAQDDVTTRNGSSAIDGAWITGPASNPLSFLNGPAYRTFGSALPYDFPDFRPIGKLDASLPKWINFEGEERFRFEGYSNGNLKLGNNDSYFLNRFRFQMDIRPNRWFGIISQVQDSRPYLQKPPIGVPNENRWDLKLAYLELGDPERVWASLRVGRQLINYNNTLIANSEWRNQGRSYDAAALNLHRNRYHLGVFAASVVVPKPSGVSHHQEGNNIYGLYGRVEGANSKTSFEPFFLWHLQPGVPIEATVSTRTAKQDLRVYGFRLKGKIKNNFDYSAEAVQEKGADGPDRIQAWASTDGVAYQFNSLPGKLRAFAQYDFASGNSNPEQGIHRTFDAVYPTTHDRFGILDLFGWQNIRSVRGGTTVILRRRWTATAQYLNFWLASAKDAAYNSSGVPIGFDFSGRSGAHVGEEADSYTWYELNRHVNIGGGVGWFGAGRILAGVSTGHTYSTAYIAINLKDAGSSESK